MLLKMNEYRSSWTGVSCQVFDMGSVGFYAPVTMHSMNKSLTQFSSSQCSALPECMWAMLGLVMHSLVLRVSESWAGHTWKQHHLETRQNYELHICTLNSLAGTVGRHNLNPRSLF
jgi:hypothetical protein